MSPVRIQRQRTRGWRMPEGVVYVGRPTRWGNPYRGNSPVSTRSALVAFRYQLTAALEDPYGSEPIDIEFRIMAERLTDLRGRHLACWCPLDQPCHADVLLELANR